MLGKLLYIYANTNTFSCCGLVVQNSHIEALASTHSGGVYAMLPILPNHLSFCLEIQICSLDRHAVKYSRILYSEYLPATLVALDKPPYRLACVRQTLHYIHPPLTLQAVKPLKGMFLYSTIVRPL